MALMILSSVASELNKLIAFAQLVSIIFTCYNDEPNILRYKKTRFA
jgi:hypothetical protein